MQREDVSAHEIKSGVIIRKVFNADFLICFSNNRSTSFYSNAYLDFSSLGVLIYSILFLLNECAYLFLTSLDTTVYIDSA